MDRKEVAAALCEIPTYLRHHPETSLSARLQEVLAARMSPVTEADLLSILTAHAEHIDSWAAFVEDQRVADGWYVAASNGSMPQPEWILARPGRTRRLVFDSPTAAYAALILRMVARVLLGSKPNRR